MNTVDNIVFVILPIAAIYYFSACYISSYFYDYRKEIAKKNEKEKYRIISGTGHQEGNKEIGPITILQIYHKKRREWITIQAFHDISSAYFMLGRLESYQQIIIDKINEK